MPGDGRGSPSRRLFFALWPDEALRAEAASCAARLVPRGAGRALRPDQLHITLVFLGAVSEARLPEVHAAAAAVEGAPIALELDQLEHWRRPQVLCLAASVVPPPLAALVEALRAALTERALPTESRPYRPHLTLARKIARFEPVAAVVALSWRANSFALVESRSDTAGSRYVPLASWSLHAGTSLGRTPDMY